MQSLITYDSDYLKVFVHIEKAKDDEPLHKTQLCSTPQIANFLGHSFGERWSEREFRKKLLVLPPTFIKF